MKKLLRAKKGATLVELVVTFALLAIFLTGVAVIFSACLGMYDTAKMKANARSVTQTLLDKVSGEISGAQGGSGDTYTMTIQKHTGQNASGNVLPYEDSACIAFCGKTNSQVYIAVSSDKHLLIHYRPVTDRVQNWEAVDWTFDDAVYRNFIIDSLSFDVVSVNGRKTNIIRVSLQITDPASGFSMNAERYVECYNFSAAEVNKIIKEEILTDSAA